MFNCCCSDKSKQNDRSRPVRPEPRVITLDLQAQREDNLSNSEFTPVGKFRQLDRSQIVVIPNEDNKNPSIAFKNHIEPVVTAPVHSQNLTVGNSGKPPVISVSSIERDESPRGGSQVSKEPLAATFSMTSWDTDWGDSETADPSVFTVVASPVPTYKVSRSAIKKRAEQIQRSYNYESSPTY